MASSSDWVSGRSMEILEDEEHGLSAALPKRTPRRNPACVRAAGCGVELQEVVVLGEGVEPQIMRAMLSLSASSSVMILPVTSRESRGVVAL